MKIRSVRANNYKRVFEVTLSRGVLTFPYSRTDPTPTSADPLERVFVDDELGREGFSYVLKSGREGAVHVDSVLEYNDDPLYMRDLLLYNLTVKAQQCMEATGLTRTEVVRRARTSPSQLARLLDVSNRTKSVDKMVVLLGALDCEVELTVRPHHGQRGPRP